MSKSKKGKRSSKRTCNVKLIPERKHSDNHAYRAAAVMAAVGLSLSAVIATMPDTVSNVMSVTIDDTAYRSYVTESDYKVPALKLEIEGVSVDLLMEAFETNEPEENAFPREFSNYISSLSEEEAYQKLNVAKVTTSSGYVRYNNSGVPMSELTVPDYVTLDENGIPTNYSTVIEGKSTAYYSGYITSTGTRPCQGTVAVDPREIPYGTEMWITSLDGSHVYGYCRAEDTGGFIYFTNGATVDLYMYEYDDCVSWGWRGVRVYILNSNG